MITKVVLKNFKRIDEQEFLLTDFDLLIGTNNSGNSTLLQATAIWQYCVNQFKQTKRKGSNGIQIRVPLKTHQAGASYQVTPAFSAYK
jgi:AAA15 family ATPase/GTPase